MADEVDHRSGATMTAGICYSRPDRYEPTTIRCAVCNMAWDIDDPAAPPCPKLVKSPPLAPERLPFKSGLPSDC